jgi:DNA-binding transcriptional ArsR family regulator
MSMPSSLIPSKIDKVIHERARLAIVSFLAAAGRASFLDLRRHLHLTDGNLSVHLRILQDAGYLCVEKSFVDRKPHTAVSLSRKGRGAFRSYVDMLERIVKGARA